MTAKPAGKLEGKVAIITGSGNGLGAECARVLASHGARIGVVDLQLAAAQSVASEIEAAGGQAVAVQCDVADEAQVQVMVAAVVARFGRIDVLHNNAAVLHAEQRAGDRDVCNVTVEAWDRAMAVNLRGAMLCCKHAIPVMLEGGGGSIIHSTSGFGAQGDQTLTAYACSKAGLMILSKSIAAQYGKRNIRSNALQIGLVENPHQQKHMPAELKQIIEDEHLTPALGTPRQIADTVAFLASDESGFITGHTLVADGGFSSHVPTLTPIRGFFEKVGSNKM